MKRWVWLLLALAAAAAPAQARSLDPLGPLTRCFDGTQFEVRSTARLPEHVRARRVAIDGAEAEVSTADGYRQLLHAGTDAPFVNLKLEQSAPGRFDDDRAAIVRQMESLAVRGASPPSMTNEQGVETAATHLDTLEARGPLSFYTFFHARTRTVATAYVLAQPAQQRSYADPAAYRKLRDAFAARMAACLARY
ncbi:MAG TPA: hypothetical protein VIT92_15495 [Burkholderiaceae bacterium]